jgi:hypothetical protein
VTRILGALAVCVALAASVPLAPAARPVRATRVVTYVPAIPRGAAVAGHCWTRSLAAQNRADAYRCMAGNSIYDPCFAARGRTDVMVCDVNPVTHGPGFAMKLTRPLPHEAPYRWTTVIPWIVELAGGDVCVPLTGTHALLRNGATVGYECSEGRKMLDAAAATGLIDGSIVPGRVWYASKAVYTVSRSGEMTSTVTRVPLAAVWR